MKKIIVAILLFQSSLILSGQHNDWIVKFKDSPNPRLLKSETSIIKNIEVLSSSLNVYNVTTNSVIQKSELFGHLNQVISISPNLEVEKRSVMPNDLFFPDQYSLDIIEVDRVWEETVGGLDIEGNEIVMAILDDGFDVGHEDLIENYWVNVHEVPNDGIDNDNNGYIDDVRGINIQNNTGTHPGVLHGTQVAGIMGAKGDNERGIAGINWNTKVLMVSGVSNIGEIIKGLEYIYDLKKKYIDTNGAEGANIVVNNFSGGLRFRFPDEFPSWCEQYDLLGSVGILSIGAVANADFEVETDGDLPTLCDSDYLIMVTNTNRGDRKVQAAAYGATSVDLGAPGEGIISAGIGNDYRAISGTSASAPHVAGSVGLLYSIPCEGITEGIENNISQFALSIKNAILNGVDEIPSLNQTVTGGRLNIFKSVFELNEVCGSVEAEELIIKAINPSLIVSGASPIRIDIEYGTDVFAEHQIYIHNSIGQLLYKETFNPNIFGDRNYMLEIHDDLPAGSYVLSIYESDKIASKPFVIVK